EEGSTKSVILAYLSAGREKCLDGGLSSDMHVNPTGDVYFRRVQTLNKAGEPVNNIFFGEPLRVALEYEVCRPVKAMRLIVAVEKLDGTLVSVLHHTDEPNQGLIDAPP